MKRGRRVDPALLEVKAPRHEEREPVFLSAAEVEHLASWCARSTSRRAASASCREPAR